MRYSLDTNVVIQLLRGDPIVLDRMRSHAESDLGISTLVHHELIYGALRSQNPERSLARVEALPFLRLSFDREDAFTASRIRADLTRIGNEIGIVDSLIAGQAMAKRLAIVTHNVREFRRVARLTVEDWQASD